MHTLSLLLLFAIEASCLSIWAPYNTLCAAGCTTVLTYLTFDGDNNITYAPCTNELFSQSYYLCVQDFCNAATGPEYAESSCQAEGYAALPLSVLSNLTAQDIAGLEVLTTDNITSPPVDPLTNAVRLSEDLHSLGYRTIVSLLASTNRLPRHEISQLLESMERDAKHAWSLWVC